MTRTTQGPVFAVPARRDPPERLAPHTDPVTISDDAAHGGGKRDVHAGGRDPLRRPD
jgi:hypothetical protein